VPIQQITCFGSGTLAITCHAKSCLNRDDCRLPFGVGLLLFFGPVSLTIDALSCCDRCLLTVNLFRPITARPITAYRDSHLISGTVVLLGSFDSSPVLPATLLLSCIALAMRQPVVLVGVTCSVRHSCNNAGVTERIQFHLNLS
jgi:hypothetical protein